MSDWGLHVCVLDRQCRRYGPPWRVHLNTPWWHLGLAMRSRDRFAKGHLDHGKIVYDGAHWTDYRRYWKDW